MILNEDLLQYRTVQCYLRADDANVSGEIDTDVGAIYQPMLVPLKMVLWVRQQATSKAHRIASLNCLVLRTSCYYRRVR